MTWLTHAIRQCSACIGSRARSCWTFCARSRPRGLAILTHYACLAGVSRACNRAREPCITLAVCDCGASCISSIRVVCASSASLCASGFLVLAHSTCSALVSRSLDISREARVALAVSHRCTSCPCRRRTSRASCAIIATNRLLVRVTLTGRALVARICNRPSESSLAFTVCDSCTASAGSCRIIRTICTRCCFSRA